MSETIVVIQESSVDNISVNISPITDAIDVIVETSTSPETTIVVANDQGPQGIKGDTGSTGPAGATGATGATGAAGTNGTNGTNGQGVVTGGTANQALTKIDGTDYNTQWTSIPLLNAANTFTASPQQVTVATTTNAGLIVQGAASQTADLIQNKNSGGTTLSGVNAAGQIYAGTTAAVVGATTTALTSAAYTSATVAVFTYGGTSLVQAGQRVTVASVTGNTSYNGTWVVSAATTTTFTVLGSGFTSGAGTGGTVKISANISAIASSTAQTPMVIQAAASQVAPVLEIQNSSGTSVFNVQNTGTVTASNNLILTGNLQGSASNGSTLTGINNSNNTLNTGAIQITGRSSNQLPLLVKQAALTAGTITAATANGTTITYTASNTFYFVAGQTVTITGVVSTGNPGATAGSGFNLTGATIATASATQFTVTNALSDTYTSGGTATITAQTADLTQWQNSAGTVLAKVEGAGHIRSGRISIDTAGSWFDIASLNVRAYTTTVVGAIIRGLASQTADLQQWQNSGGTVLASVTAAGVTTSNQPTPTAKTANATLTVAELLTGIVTSTSATAVALTLPTGTLMDGGFATLANNMSFDWSVINLGSAVGAVTMTAGATHTYVGNATVAINDSAQFRSRRISATTWETYRIS
jgi:hypothetical protein